MLLQALCPQEDILLQSYFDDRARSALVFFQSQKIDLCRLKRWQQKYPIIYPWDPTYNTVRLNFAKNGQYFPVLIMMAKKETDAQWALKTTLKLKTKLRIRAGGHDWTCYSNTNDILIDLTEMNKIEVNLKQETITVGAGVRIGQVVDKLSRLGYVLPAGTCQNVGIAGLSLGGGIGFLERLYGLTLDSMLSTRILLADGNILTTNHEQYQDLFWALRGGAGGSLGINTEFTFRIYKLVQVVLFQFWFSKDKLKQVLKFWQSWGPFTDHRLTSELNLFAKRELPVNVTGQFTGPKSELIKLTAFLANLADQSKVWTATTKEAAIHYATPFPMPFQFFRNLFAVQKLNNKMVQILDQFIEDAPTGISLEMNALLGRLTACKIEDTAFAWRDAIFWILIKGYTQEQDQLEQQGRYVRWIHKKFLQNGLTNPQTGLGRVYVNFKDPTLAKKEYPLAYWGNHSQKLSQIKTKYDPENVFSFQQSIPLS